MTPKSPTPLRAAIYARQSVSEPEGIERQVEACRVQAALRGFEVVAVYEDDNVSGYKPRGEGTAFARMLDDGRAGRFDVLIVRKLDRLGRSLSALEQLRHARIDTISTDGALDLTSPHGRAIATVITAMNIAEVEVKAERRVFANTQRRTKGVPTSGRVPYGYKWVTTDERKERGTTQAYELDEERAGDIRAMFDAFLAGVPLGAICRDLNEAGKRTLPTKRHPEGVPFRPTTLRRILMSPYYAALLPLPPEPPKPGEERRPYDQGAITRETCVSGDWPAIVTPEEWEEVKARLAHPERKTSPGPTRKWLLSGLAVCGVCLAEKLAKTGKRRLADLTLEERAELPIRAGGGKADIHSYRCRSMAHFMRRGAPLDEFIERQIIVTLSEPDAVDLLLERDRPDTDALRAERRRLEVRVRELGDDYDAGDVARPEYQRRLRKINARIAELDESLRAGVDTNALAEVVGQADVAAAWYALPLSRKRAVLEMLATVVVKSVGQGNRRNMSDEAMAKTVTIEWHQA
jgi:DNA invertase Pin-like site-specific DNA recombinase